MTNTTGNMPGNNAGHGADAGHEAKERAEAQGRGTANEIRSRTQGMTDEALRRAEGAREYAGDEIGTVSEALRKAADDIGQDHYAAQLLRQASSGIGQVADVVKGKDLGEMANSLSEFGRRNPVAFLGAAALAGFAMARFATATPERSGHARSASRGTTGNTASHTSGGGVPAQPARPMSNDPVTQPEPPMGDTAARPAPDIQSRREIE